jgi:hypothetical protein
LGRGAVGGRSGDGGVFCFGGARSPSHGPQKKLNPAPDQNNRFLVEKLNKKHKSANVKPFMVKNHLWVFINSAIENPAFDSQTKETLTTRAGAFGSKCDLPSAFLERVSKCGLLDNVLSFADFKNQKALTKSDGAKKSRLVGAFLCVVFGWRGAAARFRRFFSPAPPCFSRFLPQLVISSSSIH